MVYDGVFSLDTEDESRTYTLLDFRLDLVQSTDNFGVPRGLPRCTMFKVVLRGDGSSSTSEAKLIEWMLNPTMKKNGRVAFLSSERSGGTELVGQMIKFYDSYCIGYSINYNTEETNEFRTASYNYSRDTYTITLTLTTLSLEFSEDAILNSVIFERSGESGGSSGSSESSSSSASSGSVSSYRAD
ncbi:type VI secretion system tube protein TssD [Terrimonas rubra]|uniref:Type VI secretion system tube protein TssD n=1 Tax=Terrimonas rubra TaxID=1035890 RepID=A0ABW6A1H8_9BACT